jgi:hypothetical protein
MAAIHQRRSPSLQFGVRNKYVTVRCVTFVQISSYFDSFIEFPDSENIHIAITISVLSCVKDEIQVLPVWQPPF